MNDREQRIREEAYRLWEAEGRPVGLEHDHWFRAEQGLPEDRGETFQPADAAAAPPDIRQPATEPLPDTAADVSADPSYPAEPDAPLPGTSFPDAVDPNVRMTGGEVEPVSEIASIRRTLEVPPARRGKGSPVADTAGALGGKAGARPRPPGG